MVNRLIDPFFSFVDATGAPLENYRLFFYASGTSTKKDTGSDDDLSPANSNPMYLNSLGQPANAVGGATVAVFGQELAYKVVLAAPGTDDPPSDIVRTYDPVSLSDFTTVARFRSYNGNPNGNVAGTAGTGATDASVIYDYTNGLLYVCTTTGNAATAVWTAINSSTAVNVVPPPQGRLTPQSALPVATADVVSMTGFYYTPYVGNLVPIYNGAIFVPKTFAELPLTLVASHLANQIYDVFAFLDSGTVTIGTGPAWTTPTAGAGARGTGGGTTQLTRFNGIWVNTVSMTTRNSAATFTVPANQGTYLGSIAMDGTNGQTTFHVSYGASRKAGIWNAYNRVPIRMQAGDPGASWAYGTNTIRASNALSANSVQSFCGLPEESIHGLFKQRIKLANTSGVHTGAANIGIGVNSTTVMSGTRGVWMCSVNSLTTNEPEATVIAEHIILPSIGINNINCLEISPSATNVTITYFGTETYMKLSTLYNG